MFNNDNREIYTKEDFALEVIARVAKGQYGVKIREDGSVLLDVIGYMQSDGEIGAKPDPHLSLEMISEHLL